MSDLKYFRFWCQKVLPLVYDDSLSYYEVLCKVVDYINKLIEQDNVFSDEIEELKKELELVKEWIGHTIDTVKAEKIIFIGDSYGTSTRVNPWTEVFVNMAGLLPTQYINVCQGGIGWAKGVDPNNDFYDRLVMADGIRKGAPYYWEDKDVSKIIVAGGVFRDLTYCNYDYAALRNLVNTKVASFMNYVKSNFPNAKVYYCYCNACLNYGLNGSNGFTWQEMLNNVSSYYEEAAQYGYVFLPNLRYVLMQNSRIDLTEAGRLHPNAEGGQALGIAIHNAVYGSWDGYFSVNENLVIGEDNLSARCRAREIFDNNVGTIEIRDSVVIDIDNRSNSIYTIASVNTSISDRKFVNSFSQIETVVFADAILTDNSHELIPVYVYCNNKNLADSDTDNINLCYLRAYIPYSYGKYTRVTISPFKMQANRMNVFCNYLN